MSCQHIFFHKCTNVVSVVENKMQTFAHKRDLRGNQNRPKASIITNVVPINGFVDDWLVHASDQLTDYNLV